MSESGSDTRSGIGARLRAGRERMGLTLLQAAEKLHVDPKVVESLESERFEVLGATVFVRGHMRRYADLISEPAQPLLDLYTESTQPVAPDLTKLPKATPQSRPSQLAVPSLAVLIGFVLIGVVWWIVKALPESTTPESPTSAVTIEPEIQLPPEPAVSTEPQPVAPPPVPAVAPAPATAAPATPAAGRAMEVTLRFASDSWVEIYDSKGERLFYDVGTADSERTIRGTPPFRVSFANAPGVTLNVNGKPASVPANLVSNDAAEFTINRSGRIVRPVPKADGG
jgi:cytoskeleton protein RodZ